MSSSIQAGSVVRLKSGSPNLTVVVVHESDGDSPQTVYVRWFEEKSGEIKGDVVELSVLEVWA